MPDEVVNDEVNKKPTQNEGDYLIPENVPVIDLKDIMLYMKSTETGEVDEKIDENKKLIPYVVYLDEQLRDAMKKKKNDAKMVLILMIVIISIGILVLLIIVFKLIKYALGL